MNLITYHNTPAFAKDTVYHFVKMIQINWIRFTTILSSKIIRDAIIPPDSEDRQRLKTLTEDLVEASKASSGTKAGDCQQESHLVEMIQQTNGEFEEKYQIRHLDLVSSLPNECLLIAVDGRRLWRVLENLYNNAFKYAMENSRIYVDATSPMDLLIHSNT